MTDWTPDELAAIARLCAAMVQALEAEQRRRERRWRITGRSKKRG